MEERKKKRKKEEEEKTAVSVFLVQHIFWESM